MSGWTEERKAEALRLWDEGYSSAQIANLIGDCTRNAVIGLAHRAGKSRPKERQKILTSETAKAARYPRVRKPVVKVINNAQSFVQAEAAPPKVAMNVRAFAPLPGCAPVPFGAGGCRWPVGGEYAEMVQCGQPRLPGTPDRPNPPYCANHARAAYPPQAQKMRRSQTEPAMVRVARSYW